MFITKKSVSLLETCNKKMRCFVLVVRFLQIPERQRYLGSWWPCGLLVWMVLWKISDVCQTNLWITWWDGNKNECAVPMVPVTQKKGCKKRLCVWSLSKLSYNWGWWFGVIWYPKSSTSNNLETPFRFPTCFVVRPAAKQRSLVVGRRIGHPRNGLTLKARHRDLLGQHWFSLDIKITSIKNNI